MNMKQLWDEASLYGRVSLSTMNDGKLYCKIEFNTIKHIELKATSGFDEPTPEAAIAAAIQQAKVIVASLASAADDITKRIKSITHEGD